MKCAVSTYITSLSFHFISDSVQVGSGTPAWASYSDAVLFTYTEAKLVIFNFDIIMEKTEAGLRGLCIREIDVKSQILVT